jgi:hypothetical protein
MSKFTQLFESAIQRYTRGGFLTGDLVKFKDGYQNDEFFKRQGSNYIQKIDEFVKSGLNIRVSAIKPVRPATSAPGNIQNEGESFLIDIVLEKAPGMYYEFITVPASILEHIDTGINLAPVPDSLRYDDKLQLKPQELNNIDADSYQSPHRQTKTTDLGNVRDNKTEISNPEKNVKIPASPAEGDRDPAVAAGTARYLPSNNRRRRS